MARSKQQRLQRRRKKLWEENEGRCYWCGVVTIFSVKRGRQKKTDATIDHLRSRFHPLRSKPWIAGQESRTVLSCYACNNSRASKEQKYVPIEELWRRSQSSPRHWYSRLWRMIISRLHMTNRKI